MKNLFVYGTLMFNEVWQLLIKRHYDRHPAILNGYHRYQIKGQVYPAMIIKSNSHTNGILVSNIHHSDLLLLDRFEAEYYQRCRVNVIVNHMQYKAEAYIFRTRYYSQLQYRCWNEQEFRCQHLQRFLSRHKYFNR